MHPVREPPEPAPMASARLESDPPGAFVFIRGEPSGRVTPVTLNGLDPNVPLQYRLEKPGYGTAAGDLSLKEGATAQRSVKLVANEGLVRFTHLPRGAAVRVGNQVVVQGEETLLPLGKQTAEVIIAGQVTSSQVITVSGGPQEIALKGGGP